MPAFRRVRQAPLRVLGAWVLPILVVACAPSAGASPSDRAIAPLDSAASSSSGTAAPASASVSAPGSAASSGSATVPASGVSPAGNSTPAASAVAGRVSTSAIESGTVDRSGASLTAEHDVRIQLDFATRAISVASTATISNTSGGPIDRIELNTIAARLGRMRLGSVTVDGRRTAAIVDDQTIVVPLGGILPAGASVSVAVAYRATLRSDIAGSDWLFTRANGVAELYRWIPWPSRRLAFDRPNTGDPFMTPVSPQVRVRLTSDRPLVVATNASRTAVSDGGRYQEFVASDIRDVSLAAAPDYRVTVGHAGGVTVRVYARPGGRGAAILAAATRAIDRMSRLLVPYPYDTYTVAETAGGIGMESPGAAWIPRGARSLVYDVTHETGHQWFYGLVGNDQAHEPFADEGATDFLTRYVLGMRRASRCGTARLDLSIYRYSRGCYYEIVYVQGGNLLDSLRRTMGSTAFWAGLRDYLTTHRFGFGSTSALIDALDARTPLDLRARVRSRFPGLL